MKLLSIPVMFAAFMLLAGCGGQAQKNAQTEEKEPEKYPQLLAQAQSLFGALPETAENPENPATPEKIKLGKMLYFEKALSKDNTISCNSCHDLQNYGVDNKSFSPGVNGTLGGRNSPTVYNAALHIAQFWDGRAKDVEEQAGGPILNPVEMAMPHEDVVLERLKNMEKYKEMFAKAFPEETDPINYENVQKSIGAFERQLLTPSRFDKYVAGETDALTEHEKDGLNIFITSGCITCHTGNLFGGNMYQKFGLYGDYMNFTNSAKVDFGKFDVTGKEADKFYFKVPSLRNVEKTYPYFHDGSVSTLEDAVIIMAKVQMNRDLDQNETEAVVAFLKALTGDLPHHIIEEEVITASK